MQNGLSFTKSRDCRSLWDPQDDKISLQNEMSQPSLSSEELGGVLVCLKQAFGYLGSAAS